MWSSFVICLFLFTSEMLQISRSYSKLLKIYIKGKTNGKGNSNSISASKKCFTYWIFHMSGALLYKCIISFNIHSNI